MRQSRKHKVYGMLDLEMRNHARLLGEVLCRFYDDTLIWRFTDSIIMMHISMEAPASTLLPQKLDNEEDQCVAISYLFSIFHVTAGWLGVVLKRDLKQTDNHPKKQKTNHVASCLYTKFPDNLHNFPSSSVTHRSNDRNKYRRSRVSSLPSIPPILHKTRT